MPSTSHPPNCTKGVAQPAHNAKRVNSAHLHSRPTTGAARVPYELAKAMLNLVRHLVPWVLLQNGTRISEGSLVALKRLEGQHPAHEGLQIARFPL